MSELSDYQLLDSGNGRKLERIAGHLVIRPCVQAVWQPKYLERWRQASSECLRTADGGGQWQHRHPQEVEKQRIFRWQGTAQQSLQMPITFTNFGHCGVFFEQAAVWQWVQEFLTQRQADREQADRAKAQHGVNSQAKMLNLFGYTGCCSLAAAAHQAQVFHVDSAKGVLQWGKQAMQLSQLSGIQWIHDDARSNLALGTKRGFQYDLIVLDPPVWGHGTQQGKSKRQGKKPEKWLFDEHVAPLVTAAGSLLPPGGRLIMTSHTPGTQHQTLATLVRSAIPDATVRTGDLGVAHQDDERVLPAGVYAVADRFAA